MTFVISACIFKKQICVAISILKIEGNMQHFHHIMLYYFKKGKNATEKQKKIVQYMQKMLWWIKHVKSGLQSFMLEISHWTMLHSWVGQLKLTVIKWRH